ncbi:MAG: zf-HC2 domain-containing protein [Acidimicrobiales bacterium]
MTTPTGFTPLAGGGAWHAGADLLAAYAARELEGSLAWSLEAHLPGCARCQAALEPHLDRNRLAHNRQVVLAALGIPAPGLLERALALFGIPPHLARLIALTPALRRSWLVGVALVLGAALGTAYLFSPVAGHGGPMVLGLAGRSAGRLVPFLVLVPLLPLGGVATAFSPRLDPTHDLEVAAPLSGVQVFFARSAAVVVAALVPAVLVALGLPGPLWLPAALLLPTLAVSAVGLAASTLLDPVVAAIGVGLGWLAVSVGLAIAARSPVVAYGGTGQLTAAAVAAGALGLLLARRERLQLGWAR